LDGGQRAGRITRRRVRASVQSLPAYEADYAAEDSRQSRRPQGGGRDRSRNRRAGAPIGRADGKLETLTTRTSSSPRGAPRDACVAGTPLRGPIFQRPAVWVPAVAGTTTVKSGARDQSSSQPEHDHGTLPSLPR